MKNTIMDYLNKSAQCFPNKDAVVDMQGSITYGNLREQAMNIATFLAQENSERKSPIIVFMDKNIKAFTTMMGIAYSGNIYVPFDVHAPIERLNKMMEVMNPIAVITDEENNGKGAELLIDKQRIYQIEKLRKYEKNEKIVEKICSQILDTDPLYIICTSGSTGTPKGVVISHRAVMDFTEEASEVMEFSEREVFASQAPFYFDASVPDIYCTIRNGATVHLIPHSMFSFPVQVLGYIKEHQVNAIFWVPSALILTANLRALGQVDISCLKKVMFCGEVMPVKQLNMWKKVLPDAKYVNYYGPSEATYASTYYVIDREFTNEETLPIGGPAINTGILVLDESEHLVEKSNTETIGELCIQGSGLALGYYNNPEKTKENFVQNPLNTKYPEIIYRTGDLVKYNTYGELEYVCRKDYQIKHLGYRIELGEIETAATSVFGMERCCCLYHDRKKQIILVYKGEVDKESVKAELEHKVPDYMVPVRYFKLEEMPMNANGKIDRVKLKEEYATK